MSSPKQKQKRSYSSQRKPASIVQNKKTGKWKEVDTGKQFDKRIGTREEVYMGIAYYTRGGLKKTDLTPDDKTGKIVSKVKHESGKQQSNLDSLNQQRIEQKKQRLAQLAADVQNASNEDISHNGTETSKIFTFRHRSQPANQFLLKCTLESRQCSKSGCNKQNDYPVEYCLDHLKSEMGLCIGPSTLHLDSGQGDGLFACHKKNSTRISSPVFCEGAILCTYTGRILEPEEAAKYNNKRQFPHAQMPYSLIESDKIIDASCVRGIAAFANHKTVEDGANAELALVKKRACIIALKPIYDGEEVFVDYGYDPVEEFRDYRYATR